MCKTLLLMSCILGLRACVACGSAWLLSYVKTEWERSQTLEVTACSSPRASLSNTSLGIAIVCSVVAAGIIYQLSNEHQALSVLLDVACHCTGRICIRVVLQESLSALSYKLLIDRHYFPLWLS